LVRRRASYEFRDCRKKYRNNQHLSTSPDFFIKTGMKVKETLRFLIEDLLFFPASGLITISHLLYSFR